MIGVEGAKALGEMLNVNTTLESLNLLSEEEGETTVKNEIKERWIQYQGMELEMKERKQ